MLEAYIIDQIRRKEEEYRRRELGIPPPVPLPPLDYVPSLPPSDRGDRGVAIIRYEDEEPGRPDTVTLDLRYVS